jgi:hypothetical protein
MSRSLWHQRTDAVPAHLLANIADVDSRLQLKGPERIRQ